MCAICFDDVSTLTTLSKSTPIWFSMCLIFDVAKIIQMPGK